MKILFLSLLFPVSFLLIAQDPFYIQPYSASTYLNPALIGSTGHARVNLSYRNQWPGLSANYLTTNLATDFYSNKLKSGFGFRFMNDNAGSTILTNTLAFGYSKYLNIKDKVSVQVGFEGAYQHKKVDASKLTFGDMIDPRGGFVYTSNMTNNFSSSIFDVNTGIVLFTKKWFAGFAVHHLTEPNESLIGGNSPLPRKYTLHGGYKILIIDAPHPFTITPTFYIQEQQNFVQLKSLLDIQYANFKIGIGYGSNKSYVLALGYNNKRFSISYSYDVMENDFGYSTGSSSHELHLGYVFKWFKKTQIIPFEFTLF